MALIVEDGTGLTTAESYASTAAISTYHSARGNAAWAALTTPQMEEAARRATEYMTGAYRMRWAGERMTAEQALDWPRRLVPRKDIAYAQYYATNVVPQEVQNACAALALKAVAGDLLADQTQRKASVTVGPISTTYEAGSSAAVRYAAVDALLRPLLKLGSSQISLVRT
jgi:hypothetical protein